jgi:uncharacterized protein involved in type VI secretion and phage assembly
MPRSRTTDRRFYGVAEAIVVEVVDPAGEGRIRVRFPWFDDAMVSEWCRVAQPYAGNGYGVFLVPEVGDEVLVAFVHGDMRLPIVVGGLYNGVDKPPTSRQDDTDEKLLQTKHGHRLLFDDSSGTERVTLETAGGHALDLDDAGSRAEFATSGGHTVTLDDDGGSITIETSAGQSVTIDGNSGSITVTGMSVTIDASSISLGGTGATEALVLGTQFLTYFNTHTHTATAVGSPTTPPVVPMLPTMLSTRTRTK